MAVCWSCNSAVQDGIRWCPICRASQTDPTAGKLSSPGRRLGAFAIDTVLVVAFVAAFVLAALGLMATNGGQNFVQSLMESANSSQGATVDITPDGERALASGLIVAGVGVIAFLALNLIFYAQGTTPGKKILGMRVIKEDGSTAGMGTMILREWIGKFISHLVMSLGFIWILIDTNRQGWHDKLVSTYVVE